MNGRSLELEPRATLAGLLDQLGLQAPYALVERNGEAVARARYQELELEEGDTLVVARAVAGG